MTPTELEALKREAIDKYTHIYSLSGIDRQIAYTAASRALSHFIDLLATHEKYAIVPRVPTEAMLIDGWEALKASGMVGTAYKAMIAAQGGDQ